MHTFTIALFGEAEKGEFHRGYFCKTLPELVDCLGNPPPQTLGLFLATQALLYHRNLVFFRVQEEGFSHEDYFKGLTLLQNQTTISHIEALCAPGVGDKNLLQVLTSFCYQHHSVMIANEKDLYDYLM